MGAIKKSHVNIFAHKCSNFSGKDSLFNYPFIIMSSKSTTSSNVIKHGLHVWPQLGADMWSWELLCKVKY